MKLPARLASAIARLESIGGRCRIVGGSVRDALLGLEPKDFDVEVYELELDQIAKELSSIGKTDMVGKSFAVVKLWTQDEEYDFSIPRREAKTGAGHRGFVIDADAGMSEAEALKRRDFTINALLYDHSKKEVIDYCGGKQDLQGRTLRHVSPAFSEDPLRVFRAMQFAGRFEMSLHPSTADLCSEMRHEFWSLPKERIWGEWEKWATRSKSLSDGMRALYASGWIRFSPELYSLVNLPQDPDWHPEGDVWTHTLCCLDALTTETDWPNLPREDRCVLSFAVLCHDFGKARRTRYDLKRGAKHWISPGHESESVWLSERFLDSLNSPHLVRDKVGKLVGNHHYLNNGRAGGPSDASLRRLSRRLHPATTHELAFVLISDHCGRPPLISKEQEERIHYFITRIDELKLAESAPLPILKGRHLIELGFTPGVEFKTYLEDGYAAQLEGAFSDESSAREWLKLRVSR